MNFDHEITDRVIHGLHVVLDAIHGMQSRPSSSIFCLPILPCRGISVGSSVSVAKEDEVARANDIQEILGIVGMEGVFHGIEVIEVAEEFSHRNRGKNSFLSPRWFLPN